MAFHMAIESSTISRSNKVRSSVSTKSAPIQCRATVIMKDVKPRLPRQTYGCRLEYDLQKELDKCTGKLANFNGRGQNLAIFYSEQGINDPRTKIDDALNSWANAARIYGIENTENIYDPRMYAFANMAYGKTLRVGCAYAMCNGNHEAHIACLYTYIGAFTNNTIYEKGSGCTKNTECTTYPGSKCVVATGLCSFTGKPPAPGNGINKMCPDNSGMTDEARNKALNEHNNRRSLLARGLIRNGKNPANKNLPTSSYMPKMIYDCQTEAKAIEYANTCTLRKSEERARIGYGENVYIYSKPNPDPVIAFNEAITNWWNQIFLDGINWQLIYISSLMNKPIDQKGFVQMAWAKSVKLGCAIQTCNFQSFVVCRYSPAGNILNDPIYTPGSVCSGCQAACVTSEGLCNIL